MRSALLVAATLAALALSGCASYGVEDWGDQARGEEATFKIAPGERKLVRTPPGTTRQVYSVLLLVDAAKGAYVHYGTTGVVSDLVETGRTPNYLRVRSPGGTGIHVESPKDGGEVTATFILEWREYMD